MGVLFLGLLLFSALMICLFAGGYIADNRGREQVGYIFLDFGVTVLALMIMVSLVLSLLKGRVVDSGWWHSLLRWACIWAAGVFVGIRRPLRLIRLGWGCLQIAAWRLRVIWAQRRARRALYAYRRTQGKIAGTVSGRAEL